MKTFEILKNEEVTGAIPLPLFRSALQASNGAL